MAQTHSGLGRGEATLTQPTSSRVPTFSALKKRMARLAAERNDEELLRVRDWLLRFYRGPRQGEFWDLINHFDDIVVDRERNGRLTRYSTARKVLDNAITVLESDNARV